MRSLPRREFFADTAKLAAAMAAIPGMTAAAEPETTATEIPSPRGPNDTVRIAVCGVNGRGKEHIAGWNHLKDVHIAAICDVDLRAADRGAKLVERQLQDCAEGRPGHSPPARRQVDRRHFDRHAQPLACAGDDLGVPGRQGRLRREAGQPQCQRRPAHGRGRTQVTSGSSRPAPSAAATRAFKTPSRFCDRASSARSTWPRAFATSRAARSAMRPIAAVPSEVDYNIWLGPAPERPFNPNRFHYNWHWHWDYGNGDLGNQGIHQMDLARWGLGKTEFPKAVMASGGRFGYSDDGQTPNTLHVGFEFDDCELQFEVRGLLTNDEAKVKVGDIFYGTEGMLAITSYTTGSRSSGPSSRKARAALAVATISPTSSRPSRRAIPRSWRPTSKRGISRARTVTWGTSPIAWAASCGSSPRPNRSKATPRPTRC